MPPAPIHLALAFLLSLISFAVDFWLLKTRCCQSPALLCRYYYLGAAASFLLPAVFYLYRPQK